MLRPLELSTAYSSTLVGFTLTFGEDVGSPERTISSLLKSVNLRE